MTTIDQQVAENNIAASRDAKEAEDEIKFYDGLIVPYDFSNFEWKKTNDTKETTNA